MKPFFTQKLLQVIGLLFGVRLFKLVFITFSLYVSTFFLIHQGSFHQLLSEIKIHGIIFCCVFSIAAGGLINQFYDEEKDKIIKPFRSRIQLFLKKKYLLYSYLLFNVLSLYMAPTPRSTPESRWFRISLFSFGPQNPYVLTSNEK